jgi:hypothetical protein
MFLLFEEDGDMLLLELIKFGIETLYILKFTLA